MTTTPEAAPDDLVAELRDFPAPEYIDGKPTCTHAESLIMQAADRIEALQAKNARLEQEVHLRTCQRDEYWSCLESSASRLRLANECIEAAAEIRYAADLSYHGGTVTHTACAICHDCNDFDAKLAAWRKP